jgi:imidazolonepropionase-like amidohydrolase
VSARDFLGLALKQAIEMGIIVGPRLFFGGIGLRVTHGHGNNAQAFDGPAALVAAVRRNLLAGVDLIKIYVSGSASDPHTKLADSCMSREEIAAVVEQSHKAKRPVSSHCHGGQGLIDCLELGVDAIEHGMAMTEEDVARMAQTRSFLVATLINYPFELEQRKVMASVNAQLSTVKDKFPGILRKAWDSGIRIALGTDGRHGLMPDAMIRMVEFGFSPMEVIVASTKRGGEVCCVPQDLGTLEQGKLADVLIVKGNPLQDIRAIKDVQCVIKGGQVVKRTDLM